MKKLVAELEGNELDYAVALANGWHKHQFENGGFNWNRRLEIEGEHYIPVQESNYSPSTDWNQAGPIIERELISLGPNDSGEWVANKYTHDNDFFFLVGPTPLIAAMRVFVASKFGEYVEIE